MGLCVHGEVDFNCHICGSVPRIQFLEEYSKTLQQRIDQLTKERDQWIVRFESACNNFQEFYQRGWDECFKHNNLNSEKKKE